MISGKFVVFSGLVFCLLNPQKVLASNLEKMRCYQSVRHLK